MQQLLLLKQNILFFTDTIQGFSAVCWLFGVRMSQLYNRPIGLVKSVWGGTRIEAWSSPDALQICYPDGVPQ